MPVRFNLVDEPWLPVVWLDGTAGEVSLLEMKSTIGQTVRLKGSAIARGEWLSAGRIQQSRQPAGRGGHAERRAGARLTRRIGDPGPIRRPGRR